MTSSSLIRTRNVSLAKAKLKYMCPVNPKQYLLMFREEILAHTAFVQAVYRQPLTVKLMIACSSYMDVGRQTRQKMVEDNISTLLSVS